MKKIALLLIMVLIGTAALAAPKKAAKKVTAPNVVIEEINIEPVASPTKSAGFRLSALNLAAPGGLGSVLTYGMQLNPNLSADIGAGIGQNAAGANTNVGILLRLEMETPKIGETKTHIGGNLTYASSFNYAGATAITLNLFAGIEYPLLKNLTILSDATILEITSSAGNTSFGLGAGTANGTGLGAVAGTLYCGARLYL